MKRRLYLSTNPTGVNSTDADAINEPMLVVRTPENWADLLKAGLRPKHYRHIRDANTCALLSSLDACIAGLKQCKKALEISNCVDLTQLTPEGRRLYDQQMSDLRVVVMKVADAFDDGCREARP